MATILGDQFRLLSFRIPSAALATQWRATLAYGFLVTWLVGIGRYWDNPHATLFQRAGLGSLAYILLLSALLWLIYFPLKPRNWRYRNVLLFVSLCSLPAALYAIPVERFMPLPTAQAVNAWFLGVVATWRVALLMVFLRRVAGLGWFTVVVASLLPLALIVVSLALLNLEHVVFNLMAGISESEPSANDAAYEIVLGLSLFSFVALPFLLLAYAFLVTRVHFGGAGIARAELPDGALLATYTRNGSYTDCYVTDVAGHASQSEYVEAFYTTWLFRLERVLLAWFVRKPSSDEQAWQLADGRLDAFAAWTVEGRTPEQLLMCDFQGRTRSWLMSSRIEADGAKLTRLYFGSAVVPVADARTGKRSMGLAFGALLGFHKLYSRALLGAAARRLARRPATS